MGKKWKQWHIKRSTLTALSFRIVHSSAGIPSPPLALLIEMLPKAHLTSHSRMSGPRWVITPSWLSESLKPFLYSSLYSCHLFLISFAFVRSLLFLSFIMPILAWRLDISNFLEEISSLFHSIVFLYFFALFISESLLISPCYLQILLHLENEWMNHYNRYIVTSKHLCPDLPWYYFEFINNMLWEMRALSTYLHYKKNKLPLESVEINLLSYFFISI